MRFPSLVVRHCHRQGCTRKWKAPDCSTWNYCSRRCAIDSGRLRKDQEFRDQISMTFVELAHPEAMPGKGYK